MSPILPDPKALAGRWSVALEGESSACVIDLTVQPLGRGLVVKHDGVCLGRMNLAAVAMWRPAPDGIALAQSSGKTAAFFSRKGNDYISRRPGCPTLILSHKPG